MGIAALVLISAMSTSVITTGAVSRFPGDYYDTRSRTWLQRQAMTRWPGPDGLLRMWSEEKLSERQRMAVLLGGASRHCNDVVDRLGCPNRESLWDNRQNRQRCTTLFAQSG